MDDNYRIYCSRFTLGSKLCPRETRSFGGHRFEDASSEKAAAEFRGNRGVLAIFRLDDAEIRDAGGRSTGARSVRFAAARPDKSEGAELEKMTLTG